MQNKYMKNLITIAIILAYITVGVSIAKADCCVVYSPYVVSNGGVTNGYTTTGYNTGNGYTTNGYNTNNSYTTGGYNTSSGYVLGGVFIPNGYTSSGGYVANGYNTGSGYVQTGTYITGSSPIYTTYQTSQAPYVVGPAFSTPAQVAVAPYQGTTNTTTTTNTTNTITKPLSVNSQFSTLGSTNGFEGICPGQELNYTLTYQNTDKTKTLTNTVLRVTIPQEIAFDSASAGDYSQRDGTLTVFIGTLTPLQTGVVYIKAVAGTGVYGKELITTRTELSFTLPDGTQDTAVSYVFNNGLNCDRSSLGALALFSGGFFPDTFWGWVVLIIVVCTIIYIARKFYEKPHTHDVHSH